MARVNITVPDALIERAREAGLNVSGVASAALAEELDRRARIAELDAYLDDLAGELGPIPDDERLSAEGVGRPGVPCGRGPERMTVVLDSGGLGSLAGSRARLAELRRRGQWPAQVPAVVLTEALSGDHRRDFAVNRLLRTCQIRDVDEQQARVGARLRTATGRAETITAVDALAATVAEPVVITSDPHDLRAQHADVPVTVLAV